MEVPAYADGTGASARTSTRFGNDKRGATIHPCTRVTVSFCEVGAGVDNVTWSGTDDELNIGGRREGSTSGDPSIQFEHVVEQKLRDRAVALKEVGERKARGEQQTKSARPCSGGR